MVTIMKRLLTLSYLAGASYSLCIHVHIVMFCLCGLQYSTCIVLLSSFSFLFFLALELGRMHAHTMRRNAWSMFLPALLVRRCLYLWNIGYISTELRYWGSVSELRYWGSVSELIDVLHVIAVVSTKHRLLALAMF